MQIVLYSFRRCPYAMRARMALRVSQIDYEHREIELKAKPSHLLDISPKGTVPVIWIRDGEQEEVIDQSLEIMKWSLKRSDPEMWLSKDPQLNDAMMGLIEQNDQTFKFNLDRYKYPHRFGLDDPLPFRAAGELFLQELNSKLLVNRFLFGSRLSIADAALMPFVRQFSRVEPQWFEGLELAALKSWLEGLEGSDLFVSIMARHELWGKG